MRFRVVKISRLQANLRKQQNYFTSKISQHTVLYVLSDWYKVRTSQLFTEHSKNASR